MGEVAWGKESGTDPPRVRAAFPILALPGQPSPLHVQTDA